MQVLADTGVWFRFVRRLPLPKKIETTLTAGETQRYLCPISSMEIIRKWQSGKLPVPIREPGSIVRWKVLKFRRSPNRLHASRPHGTGIIRISGSFDCGHG